jgi:hypothetical protein
MSQLFSQYPSAWRGTEPEGIYSTFALFPEGKRLSNFVRTRFQPLWG